MCALPLGLVSAQVSFRQSVRMHAALIASILLYFVDFWHSENLPNLAGVFTNLRALFVQLC